MSSIKVDKAVVNLSSITVRELADAIIQAANKYATAVTVESDSSPVSFRISIDNPALVEDPKYKAVSFEKPAKKVNESDEW